MAKKNFEIVGDGKKDYSDEGAPILSKIESKFVRLYLQEPNLHRVAHQMELPFDQVCKMRRKSSVLAAIRQGRKRVMEKCTIAPARMIKELERIVFSDITEYEYDPETGDVEVVGNSPAATRAIASIRRRIRRRVVNPGDGETAGAVTVEEHEVDVKLWNKLEAMKLMATLLGWTNLRSGEAEPRPLVININENRIMTPNETHPSRQALPAPEPEGEVILTSASENSIPGSPNQP